jgi:RsiW-degrading membrane proteinase PrsW (M82 family)
MMSVGFCEEVAKLMALLAGVRYRHGPPPLSVGVKGCCDAMWRYVVTSPLELVVLGLSVGFGFMTTENVEYFTMINLDKNGDLYDRIVATLVRCFLNLHPLLTGLVACRLGARVYSKDLLRTNVTDWAHVSMSTQPSPYTFRRCGHR